MAEVPTNFRGTLYDLQSKSARQVFLDGVTWRSDVGIGGGPVLPPEGGGGGQPPGIWPGPGPLPHPEHPIAGVPGTPGYEPPGIWGPRPGFPTPPIVLPPDQVPPGMQPPTTPPPGTVTPVPPPAGSGGWPVQPVAVPEYLVVQYPGVGPVYVTAPVHVEPAA